VLVLQVAGWEVSGCCFKLLYACNKPPLMVQSTLSMISRVLTSKPLHHFLGTTAPQQGPLLSGIDRLLLLLLLPAAAAGCYYCCCHYEQAALQKGKQLSNSQLALLEINKLELAEKLTGFASSSSLISNKVSSELESCF